VTITDAALALSGARFMIQRVQFGFITPSVRRYRIEWGDAPTTRLTDGPPAQGRGARDTFVASPTHAFRVLAEDLTPRPGATQTITAQLVNGAGEPWRLRGKTATWSLVVTDEDGNVVTGSGSVSPSTSDTDADGKATTVLTAPTTEGHRVVVLAAAEVAP
jgi:hypothetical protein